MPTLKHLTCSLEWTGSKTPLKEYRTAYCDGLVETFVAIPSIPTPFSVRLRSHGYIAPGLAMFVYVDGDYQCNRNRRNLKIPDGTTLRKDTEINFNVRQKEDMLADGTFIAKEWRFEKVKTASGDLPKLDHGAPHGANYVGMIEVVVLRCRPVSVYPGAGEAPVPHLRSLKAPTGSLPVGKNLKVVTSLPLSDDSSESSETSGPFIGTFDGAGDQAPPVMSFGGDAAWDEFLPPTPKVTQRAGAWFSSPATSDVTPLNESSGSVSGAGSVLNSQWHGRNQSHFHFEQDWSQSGRPGSQITRSPNSPRTQAQGKGGRAAKTEAANASVSESKLSAPGNTIPGEPGRQSPTVQRTHAVIVDTNQEDSTAGPWVFRPLGSAVSLADDWVTRRSRRENGEEKSQASHEPKATQKPTTSWQAPATWNESKRGGQPSDDEQEIPRESASRKSLVNLLIRSDTSDKVNKDSKGLLSNTANSGTAEGGWTVKTTGKTLSLSHIQESKKRDSWDSISPTGVMPGAWCTNDEKRANNTAGWSPNAVSAGQQIQSPSGGGHESCNIATKKSDREKCPAVLDTSKPHSDGKKEAIPGDLMIDARPATQSSSWSKPEKNATSSNQGEDTVGLCGLEVNVGPRSETHVSKPPSSGGTAQLTGWGLPSSKGQGRPSFLEKVRSRLGSPSVPKDATSFAEHDKNKPETPGGRTRPGSGPITAADPDALVVPSQLPHQKPAGSDKNRSQQAPAVGTRSSHLTAAEIYRKPYWSTRSKVSARQLSTTGDGHSDASPDPENSLYTLPEEVVQRNHVSHQVRQGKPVVYAHKTAKPKYMDSHESPYAVFVFNYRSEDAIQEMLSIEVIEDEDEEKRRLLSLSKAELIELFMRAKAKEPNPQPGAAGAWQNTSGLDSVAGGTSVKSPKGMNGPEARATNDNDSGGNAGIGIDLNGLAKGFANLQTSPKNASDAGSPNPDTFWGRKEQKSEPSKIEAGGWYSNSSNHKNGVNWKTSSSTDGNDQGGGEGAPAGSPPAQRNNPSTARNKWSGSVAQEQKSKDSDWKPGNSNAENNWGGESNINETENENGNAGHNWGVGSDKKDNKNEDSSAGYNWGGGSPTSQGQNNKPNASANEWDGSRGESKTSIAGGSGSGGGWAGAADQSNSWGGNSGAKGDWGGGGGGSGWGGGGGKGSGGNGNDWGEDSGTKRGWAGSSGGPEWGGDDGKRSGENGNKRGGGGQKAKGGDDGTTSGGNGNNWGGSGQNGQGGGDTQW